MSQDETGSFETLLELTGVIVAAYVAHNPMQAGDVPALIGEIHRTLAGLRTAPEAPARLGASPGAVSVRRSLADPDRIISMIDGKAYQMLRRHLSNNGHTPVSYRQAFNLPHDYPMTAPGYSQKRRAIALAIGLGQKAEAAPAVPKRRTGTISAFAKG
ncbi:MucR family transcriptional regulator [Sphingomonas sp. BIUV-7]|uniref:MucR family transcriptional regulator n=1 Tax=Sphingomonas natans TaxID=3063330 RepID=A0ABT8YCH9_9SPHN|nr:MucR family transcriptional regulator [Sphingomonas sp. BIUV-7]MDO6416049.1 MucR family transcriptional regulator [Sphingomonas sp. BIUV-7]